MRISMADIAAAGPFSAFPGVMRWFVVVTGAGVVLDLDGAERRIVRGDQPVEFDGASAPGCRLLDGPTRDLNLMTRGGRGGLWPLVPDASWSGRFQVRALFTAVPGRWSSGAETRELPQHTLLWEDSAAGAEWRFEPQSAAGTAGWWLGYSP